MADRSERQSIVSFDPIKFIHWIDSVRKADREFQRKVENYRARSSRGSGEGFGISRPPVPGEEQSNVQIASADLSIGSSAASKQPFYSHSEHFNHTGLQLFADIVRFSDGVVVPTEVTQEMQAAQLLHN